MLMSLYQALLQKISPLNLPVYLADCVPEGTGFPCIVLDIAAPAQPAEDGKVTLTIWCRGNTANHDRLRLMERLLMHLPARGTHLALDSGAVTLRMNDSVTCVHSKDALGVKTLWTLHFYPSV